MSSILGNTITMLEIHWTTAWVLISATACVAAPAPGVVEPATTPVAAREPNPPLDIVISPDEFGPPRASNAVVPEPEPSFEPTPVPWRRPATVVSGRQRGCSVVAVTDPEVLVVYSMIDVYSLIASHLTDHLQPSLPERAKDSPCAHGYCRPDVPHAVLIGDDDGHYPNDGQALGFLVPIGVGYWVLPLEVTFREAVCMADVKAEKVEDGHARLRIHYEEAQEETCDDSGPDEICGTACFDGGATQYDLFYDAETQRALLVTRSHDQLDDSDEPKPAIEVVREENAVRIDGCKADAAIPWPPS
jgi:hypothetical protein